MNDIPQMQKRLLQEPQDDQRFDTRSTGSLSYELDRKDGSLRIFTTGRQICLNALDVTTLIELLMENTADTLTAQMVYDALHPKAVDNHWELRSHREDSQYRSAASLLRQQLGLMKPRVHQ